MVGIGRVRAGLLATIICLAVGSGWAQTPGGGNADEYVKRGELGFQWHGDLSLREDVRLRSDQVSQQRFRARLRIGAKGSFGPNASWNFRLATVPENAVSPWMTLAGGDGNGAAASFGLDQASLRFAPTPALQLEVGKMQHPYWASEGIFDDDVCPPGAALHWRLREKRDGAFVGQVSHTFGVFAIRELGAVSADPFMVGNQLTAGLGPVTAAAGLYWFEGLNSAGANAGAAGMVQANNQILGTGRYSSDEITVVHGRVMYPFSVRSFPVRLYADAFVNLNESEQNLGFEAKVEFPKLGRGRGHALWRDVNQNAAFSPWADSSLGEGTSVRSGVELAYRRPLVDRVDFSITYFHYDRYQPLTAPGPRSTDRLFLEVSAKL